MRHGPAAVAHPAGATSYSLRLQRGAVGPSVVSPTSSHPGLNSLGRLLTSRWYALGNKHGYSRRRCVPRPVQDARHPLRSPTSTLGRSRACEELQFNWHTFHFTARVNGGVRYRLCYGVGGDGRPAESLVSVGRLFLGLLCFLVWHERPLRSGPASSPAPYSGRGVRCRVGDARPPTPGARRLAIALRRPIPAYSRSGFRRRNA